MLSLILVLSCQAMPRCFGVPATPMSSSRSLGVSSRTWRARASALPWCACPSTWRWAAARAAAGGSVHSSSAKPSSSCTSFSAPSPCSASLPSLWTGGWGGWGLMGGRDIECPGAPRPCMFMLIDWMGPLVMAKANLILLTINNYFREKKCSKTHIL